MKFKVNWVSRVMLIGVLAFGMMSCQDFLEEEPKSVWGEGNFYKTQDQAELALAGIYGTLRGPDAFGENLSSYMVAGTDEGYLNQGWVTWAPSLYVHQTTDNMVSGLWTSMYSAINNANNLIKHLDESAFDEATYQHYLAEARFLRGFCYSILTSWWNEVPLRTEPTVDQTSNHIAPSELVDVYALIIDDFTFAADNLPHVMDGNYVPGRAHNMAAHGLLARLYMKMAGAPYNQTSYYQNAKDQCDIVMTDGNFGLRMESSDSSGYELFFKDLIGNSYDLRESLFEITYMNNLDIGIATMGANGLYNGLTFKLQDGSKHPTTNKAWTNASFVLNQAYDDTDKRRAWNVPGVNYAWNNQGFGQIVLADEVNGLYTPGKFRRWDWDESLPYGWGIATDYELLTGESLISVNQTPINFPILRYSDILLMWAEADNEINGPTQAAIDEINEVRVRAGAAEIALGDYADKEALLAEIMDERLREFCFEGLRKHDLIRWDKLGERLDYYESEWTKHGNYNPVHWIQASLVRVFNAYDPAKHNELPYPFQEVVINNSLEQKDNWQ